jgi:flagellar basal-body rod modification protein FlgD
MAVESINAANAAQAATTFAQGRVPIQTLSQDDFLKLLVAQMTSQDPLNPTKDTEFIAQMASFSSLEQARAMQTELSRLRADQALLNANALLGRTVDITEDDGTVTTGLVNAVQVEAGSPRVVVNGRSYELSRLSAITPTAAPIDPEL